MEQRTITLDDVQYNVSDFSPGVQSAVGIYNAFQADLQREQMAVMKTQGAMQTLSAQIGDAVRKELAEKASAAEAKIGEADAADVVADTAE